MPRKEPERQSPESLNATAKQIEETAALFRAIAVLMQEEGFHFLDISNFKQLKLGMKAIDNFAGAARHALREARDKRGDFTASSMVRGVPESGSKRTENKALKKQKRTRFSSAANGSSTSQVKTT